MEQVSGANPAGLSIEDIVEMEGGRERESKLEHEDAVEEVEDGPFNVGVIAEEIDRSDKGEETVLVLLGLGWRCL